MQDASDRDLDTLYRSALALVMPSRYEGFGFTPLEAMARECPVLASDIPAFREVSGSGALLVPLDEGRWAESLPRLAGDEALRADLRERGRRDRRPLLVGQDGPVALQAVPRGRQAGRQ